MTEKFGGCIFVKDMRVRGEKKKKRNKPEGNPQQEKERGNQDTCKHHFIINLKKNSKKNIYDSLSLPTKKKISYQGKI